MTEKVKRKLLETGEEAPDFTLKDEQGNDVSLSDFRGNWVVLYFYPKDNTPGCTAEACEFSAQREDFTGLNGVIVGVSPDSVNSHRNFVQKKDLTIKLLSDPEKKVLDMYGAVGLKRMFGKEYLGVIRSTYLINPEGKVAHVWPKVKARGHAEKVKNQLEQLQE